MREARSENGAPKTVSHLIIQRAVADTAVLQSLVGNGNGDGIAIRPGPCIMPHWRIEMAKLWILRGDHEAPGWNELRKAYEDETVDIIHLDAKVWAIIDAEEEPAGYEGLHAKEPDNGMYIDPNGSPLFLFGGAVVPSAEALIECLGDRAKEILAATGDAETTLTRLGRVF